MTTKLVVIQRKQNGPAFAVYAVPGPTVNEKDTKEINAYLADRDHEVAVHVHHAAPTTKVLGSMAHVLGELQKIRLPPSRSPKEVRMAAAQPPTFAVEAVDPPLPLPPLLPSMSVDGVATVPPVSRRKKNE